MTSSTNAIPSVVGRRAGSASIELRGVEHSYTNGKKILHGMDLSLDGKGLISLIGPSGAGKSTVLRLLNGLLRPTSGTVVVNGSVVSAARGAELRHIRRNTGMIFQTFNLVRRLTAIENVLLGRLGYQSTLRTVIRMYRSEDVELAMSLLERVGLSDHAHQRVDTMSGGQQQRVAIARALAQRPTLLLADEPISALDPKSANRVMEILQSIAATDGISVIASLHSVSAVRDFASFVVGMKSGRLQFSLPVGKLGTCEISGLYETMES
ncbi:phosphonate ABC transporter ATP-binding protein [Paraburkholderia sp. BR14263]|uniref:phosphonate ABC transporter ATP-binding protein n=1 Tax=unclassified Paraburkholderia TaxID=2615204 RepID=UPI0034CD78E1